MKIVNCGGKKKRGCEKEDFFYLRAA